MKVTEKLSHAAERKAFETVLDNLIKKGQTQDAGKIMPPKSTWFEPKLMSGLFIHKLS